MLQGRDTYEGVKLATEGSHIRESTRRLCTSQRGYARQGSSCLPERRANASARTYRNAAADKRCRRTAAVGRTPNDTRHGRGGLNPRCAQSLRSCNPPPDTTSSDFREGIAWL